VITFGAPDHLYESFRLLLIIGVVLFPFIFLLFRKGLSLGVPSCFLATFTIYAVAVAALTNSLATQFHSLERQPNSVVLNFKFPYDRQEEIKSSDITDIRFGLEGKAVHQCYISVYTKERRIRSQLTRDCEHTKKTAILLRGIFLTTHSRRDPVSGFACHRSA
jgi:hypothetical protein